MRAKTLVAAAAAPMLTATIAFAAPAGAAPAVSAAKPPLVYTTYAQSADGGDTRTVDSVRYDGTGHKRIASTALVVGGGVAGSEVVGPAATYSPDHTRVVWTQADWGPTDVDHSVEVETLATKAVASFPLPAGSGVGGGSYPRWYPDGSRLLMALTRGSATTITSLDLATGTFTPLFTPKHDDQVESLAVSADGTVAFASTSGVGVLTGTPATARYLYRSGTDESCTAVRARPGTKHEFTYLCSTFGTGGQQVLRSQTTSGAARTLYTGDISSPASPVTFLEGFAWAPSGSSVALLTTTVTTVDEPTCTNAMTTTLSSVNSNGNGRSVLQTEPTITAQTCRGNGWGDVDTVAWSPDGQTVVFLHAPKFLGPMVAYAVRPAAAGNQTALAKGVIDLSS